MTPHAVLMALAILVSCDQFDAYTIDYWDCRDIDKLTTYRMNKACSPRTLEGTKTIEYTLLQKRGVLDMKGFSCHITRSTLTEYCGAYSHTKLAKTPDIEVAYQVSPQACLNIVNTGVFTTPSGTRHKITLNAENIIKMPQDEYRNLSASIGFIGSTYRRFSRACKRFPGLGLLSCAAGG